MRRRETWEGDLNLIRMLRHDFSGERLQTVVNWRVLWFVLMAIAAALVVIKVFVQT